jgi:hypothetical protein
MKSVTFTATDTPTAEIERRDQPFSNPPKTATYSKLSVPYVSSTGQRGLAAIWFDLPPDSVPMFQMKKGDTITFNLA